jgi:hypothetical protein
MPSLCRYRGGVAKFRMYPTRQQESITLEHCAHARYMGNLAVEQHSHGKPGRKSSPGFAERCRQLTEARRDNAWLRAGNADVQQQALKGFAKPSRPASRPGSESRPGVTTCGLFPSGRKPSRGAP